MSKEYLGTYSGMPGTRRPLKGPSVSSVSGFMRAIRKHRCANAAGDDGSVLVWWDDKRVLNATFCRYLAVRRHETFTTKIALERWLNVWLPRTRHFVELDAA